MKEPEEKAPTSPNLPQKRSNDNDDSVFEPNSVQVKRSFLDLLNGESEKMTAALQNPANHEAIIRASREAPAKIAELEKETGMRAIFGPGAAVSKETVEQMLGEKLPEEMPHRRRIEEILAEANAMVKILPWWKRALNRILYYIGVSLYIVTPIPNMQLQKCMMRVESQVMTIRCDSSRVCPEGYHLDTWWAYVPRQDGELIQTMFGYGPAVKNSCQKGSGPVPAKDIQVLP